MSVRGGVHVDGLSELMKQLTDAPDEIRAEAMGIVREETEGAAVELAQAYPRKTGTLASRVKTSYPASGALVGVVLSTAPHAHLFEFGTKDRFTGSGRRPKRKTRAFRGRMPADKITPGIAQRRRARMQRRLKEMLVRRGYQVSET